MKRTEAPQDTALDASDVLAKAIEDLDRAVRSSHERSREWVAWTALQRVDERGLVDVQPYSREAIAILDSAFSTDDSDCHVIHHLAIAYHAMAWDLELSDPGGADRAWESALFFWRKLQGCSQFWEDLYSKGERLGSAFDANALAEVRRNLLPYLLEVHVDFMRYYHQVGRARDAARHVGLVKRARIAPVLRGRLADLAYRGTVPGIMELENAGKITDALDALECFLDLFPASVAGLQKHLELVRTWVDQSSPECVELPQLAVRADGRWFALQCLARLSDYPLAMVALEGVADALGRKLSSRAKWLWGRRRTDGEAEHAGVSDGEHDDAYTQAIVWLERSAALTPNDPDIGGLLAAVLAWRADFRRRFAVRGDGSADVDLRLKGLDDAMVDCRRAIEILPGEAALTKLAAGILWEKALFLINVDEIDVTARLERGLEAAVEGRSFDADEPRLQELEALLREALAGQNSEA